MAVEDRGRTTVAFELEALERVADPAAVFTQTAGWARAVGLVSDRSTPVQTQRAREWGIDYAFTSGSGDLLESLISVRQQPEHDADRYLLIGTDAVDGGAVAERGWAYLPLEEAAEAGGWRLAPTDPPDTEDESRGWP